MKEPTKPGSV